MKITRYYQLCLSERISDLYLKATLALINRGCTNPAKLAPWVETIGIHSLIPPAWEENKNIEIGPIQSKNIVANARKLAMQAIRHCDEYAPIREHLDNMGAQGKDISGHDLPAPDPK